MIGGHHHGAAGPSHTHSFDGQLLSYTDAALAALQAGCDMVLLCNQSLGDGKAVDELLADRPRLVRMGAAARSLAKPDAAARIADVCLEVAA